MKYLATAFILVIVYNLLVDYGIWLTVNGKVTNIKLTNQRMITKD